MGLEFTSHIRTPLVVEAVEITEENLEEVAVYLGEVRETDGGSRYIEVDRRIAPRPWRVKPGFFMTKSGEQVRCFTAKRFAHQFVPATGEAMKLVGSFKEMLNEQPSSG